MTAVQPTQGRITFKEDGDANHYSMLTEDGRWWLAILANGEQTSARQVANFRRLAACWNACDGIDTEKLEKAAGDRAPVFALLMEAAGQRDELLKTLAAERERWATKCDEVAAILQRDPDEKKQISAHMANWLAGELRHNAERLAAPQMRKATRNEKIVNPGVYEVPALPDNVGGNRQ